jgi:signal transduction histidine kinase
MTTLRSVVAQSASVIRCIGIAYVAVQLVIWHSFYQADPWRLTGPVAAMLWAAAVAGYLWRGRPSRPVVCLDSGVYLALALSAGWCVPPATRGGAASWLFIAMASTVIVPAWFVPTAVSAPLALASAAAYWAGTAATGAGGGAGVVGGGAGGAGNSAVAAASLLLATAAMHWCGRQMLDSRAGRADAALEQADRDSREHHVVLSRNIERREHERLLHDTVLNTLTALARTGHGDAGEAVGRCRHDVALMEYALSDADSTAGRLHGGLPGGLLGGLLDDLPGGLLGGIEAVAAEMRARGLIVHLEVTSGVPAGPGGGALTVPVPVAAAIAHAVREALANVAAHAGTGEAWVKVNLAARGGAGPASGGFLVTVRDLGAGFDATRLDPARLGLRRSITERVADWGGRASIGSAPGDGTVVCLCWPASAPPVAARTPDQAGLP